MNQAFDGRTRYMFVQCASVRTLAYDRISECRGNTTAAANSILRNVNEEVALARKELAEPNAGSTKAEHREILKAALKRRRRKRVTDILANMPDVGDDLDFDTRKG